MTVKIKIATLGNSTILFSHKKITNWKSELFSIDPTIDNFVIRAENDLDHWEYSDSILETQIRNTGTFDIYLYITSVPLEDNYFARRLGSNSIILTFHDMHTILGFHHIPFENLILRVCYAYCFVYLSYDKRIPLTSEGPIIFHSDTRRCIFDMNGNKMDVIFSLHKPIICSECAEKLRQKRITDNFINSASKELNHIKKSLFMRLLDWIQKHPIISIIISLTTALLINICSTLLTKLLFNI